MSLFRHASPALLILLSTILTTVPLGARTATGEEAARAAVSSFYQVVGEVSRQSASLGYQGRYQRLAPAVRQLFALDFMARIASGPAWDDLSAADQQQIRQLFADFTIANFAGNFTAGSEKRFEVDGARPARTGRVLVDTRLVPSSGKPVSLSYLMAERDGRWSAIDIYVDDTISELARRRSEFSSILQRQGAEGLIQALRSKIAELARG